MIFTDKLHQNIQYYLLILFCFFFPLYQQISIYIAILLAVNWLCTKATQVNVKNLFNLMPILFIGFYLLYIVGLLYSQNQEKAWLDLVRKASLLLFPIMLFTSTIDTQKRKNILNGFVVGCIAAICYTLINIGIVYFDTGLENCTYRDFCSQYFHWHPTYFALYLSFALLIFDLNYNTLQLKYPILRYALIAFFFIFITLLGSRIIILSLLLILGTIYLYAKFKSKHLRQGLSTCLVALFTIGFTIYSSPNISERMGLAATQATNFYDAELPTNPRKDIWIAALSLVKGSPFIGYGSGDVRNQLKGSYKNFGFDFLYQKNFNSHNQYLEIAIAFGLIGLLFFIIHLLIPLFSALEHNAYLYILFLSLFILANLTESTLEVQNGVVFFAFFNSFFASSLMPIANDKKDKSSLLKTQKVH